MCGNKYKANLDYWKTQQQKALKRQADMLKHAKSKLLPYPKPNDILLGRGRPFQDYPGNQMMTKLINSYREQYDHATERLDKMFICLSVTKEVQERGSRFLQRTSLGWEEVDQEKAEKKVIKAFRCKPDPTPNKRGAPSFGLPQPVESAKRVRYDDSL